MQALRMWGGVAGGPSFRTDNSSEKAQGQTMNDPLAPYPSHQRAVGVGELSGDRRRTKG